MKKWFVAFLLIIIIAWVAIYFIIPNKLEIAKTEYLDIHSDIVHRHLSEQTTWHRWWPEKAPATVTKEKQSVHFVDKTGYTISQKLFNALEVHILTETDTVKSRILIVSLSKDSTALHWSGTIETGFNPFQKITQYQRGARIKEQMNRILKSLESFLRDTQNLYSISIERSTVKDTLLISMKRDLDHYPTTAEVYELVSNLKQYISKHGAKEMNFPMLNISKTGGNRFRVMVAIPVDRALQDNEPFAFKRMVPGNILVTDVKGGRHTIDKALAEMELYIKEHKLTPPAISFESMVTDRSKEPDTSKWVTRIYYPIL